MEYAALLLFVVSASVTPGPNNLMIMASGLNHGIKRSIPHLLGIDLGFTLMVVAVGLGMAGIFSAFPRLHDVLKVIGTLYLLWLAWKIASAPVDGIKLKERKPFSFMQAALFQWVNPKAWIMIVGAVATYTSAGSDYTWQVMFIALSFLLLGTPCTIAWLLFGTSLKRFINTPGNLRIFNISMALLLVASLLPGLLDLITAY